MFIPLLLTTITFFPTLYSMENNTKIITHNPNQSILLYPGITHVIINAVGELSLHQLSENKQFYEDERLYISKNFKQKTPIDLSSLEITQDLATNTLIIKGNNALFLEYCLYLEKINRINLTGAIALNTPSLINPIQLTIDISQNSKAHITRLQSPTIHTIQRNNSNLIIEKMTAKTIYINSHNVDSPLQFIGKNIEADNVFLTIQSINLRAHIIAQNIITTYGPNSYIHLSGETKFQNILCNGNSDYDAFNLKTNKTTIKDNHNGPENGSIKIGSTDNLQAEIKNSTLYYTKNVSKLSIKHKNDTSIYSCKKK